MVGRITPEFEQDVWKHIFGCDRLSLVYDENGRPLAFLAASLRNSPYGRLYHVEGVISPRRRGLAQRLLEIDIIRSPELPVILAFHTQNRRMFNLGLRLADFDPLLAASIAPLIGTRNQLEVVDKGRYGGKCLYGDPQEFSKDALSEVVGVDGNGEQIVYTIDWQRGDALIFAGWIKSEIISFQKSL